MTPDLVVTMLERLNPCSANHGEAKTPNVFIGMPVFNGCPYIEDALQSLTTQTFQDWRLLIADNCSTDATADICKRFADADSRITYVRHEKNHGAGYNFRYVLDAATGEFFMWAAHDDRHAPTFIKDLLDRLEHGGPSTAVAMSSGRLHFARDNRFVDQPVQDFTHAGHAAILIHLLIAPVPALIYGVWRTAVIQQLFTQPFYDFYDCALTTRLLCQGHRVETLPDQFLYTAGIAGSAYEPKPSSRKQGRLFEYLPFTKCCLREVWSSRSISLTTKIAATLALLDFVMRSIIHWESPHQKWLVFILKPVEICCGSVVRRVLYRLYPV